MKNHHPTSLFSKLLLCLLSGITAGATLARLGHRFLVAWLPLPIIYGASLLLVLAALIAAGVWHHRDKSREPQKTTLAYWQGVLRYAVALDLSMFGWQKIFHLQFITPLAMLDEPFSSFTGEWLTWSYFGHSYPFVVAVALLQIGGSYVLLFRRTRLLAVFILMPVMVNIVLIDLFYGLETIVLIHACIHTTALLYLMLCERRRLWTFFLNTPAALPPSIRHPGLRNTLRISAMIIPLILLATYHFPDHYPHLTGKYTVHNLRINGNPIRNVARQDSVLTDVYLDIADECVFTFNSLDRRAFGHYTFNEATDSLHITWHYPIPNPPRLRATLTPTPGDSLRLNGIIGHSHITAAIRRVK